MIIQKNSTFLRILTLKVFTPFWTTNAGVDTKSNRAKMAPLIKQHLRHFAVFSIVLLKRQTNMLTKLKILKMLLLSKVSTI